MSCFMLPLAFNEFFELSSAPLTKRLTQFEQTRSGVEFDVSGIPTQLEYYQR